MTHSFGWTRRTFLAAKAMLAGSFALPAGAIAATSGASEMAVGTQGAVAPARWSTATADELQPFVGQRFRVKTKEHGHVVLKLVDVQSPSADPDRPAHLPRRVSVSALFEGPEAHLLAEAGDGVHTVSHPRIGTSVAFLKPLPRQAGGYDIEMVLN
ncbi:hypothetical protein [uncultured Tateyamaria sp.]|uniref:DUF6916 family protein n=1 Tax=uncultured Tateyamaria sp. TaxID=455651 RepID=UPI002614CE20|nr:hypothetical protein [uncultured Tateyamaria sp.]